MQNNVENKTEKILVLGGTGAMGQYLVPELLELGYYVDVVSLDDVLSDNEKLRYYKANAKDKNFLLELFKNQYDGIVDFMTYNTEEFRNTYRMLLENTRHYIFLSSCRVFANKPPITEKSPFLLDVSDDLEFLATDDYSLYKAREERILQESGYSNWTIVRPATTFSRGKFQLVTLEAPTFLYRMQAGKTVVLPEEAMKCQATLCWGGDVAKMIARLVLNDKAYGEDYNVASSEHHSWREIADIYNEICPYKYITVNKEDYLGIISDGGSWTSYQLIYGRMFERITDNKKVLSHTGLKQENFMTLKDALKYELERSQDYDWKKFENDDRNRKMDEYLKNKFGLI